VVFWIISGYLPTVLVLGAFGTSIAGIVTSSVALGYRSEATTKDVAIAALVISILDICVACALLGVIAVFSML
jgi:hypothetical protein